MNRFLIFIIITPLLMHCQDGDSISKSEWKSFLEKFPTKSFESISLKPTVENVSDTISRLEVNKFLWWDDDKPLVVYDKLGNFKYPIGGKLFIQKEPVLFGKSKSGERCNYKLVSYPFYKIRFSETYTIVSYLEFILGEGLIAQSMTVLDQDFNKVGYFAFLFSHSWINCDNTLEEILAETQPLSAPVELYENGFLLHDQMVGSYYEDVLDDEYWKVLIREDGKFEIVEEKKNYEDGTVMLWSKYGYYVSDPDGYTNLRESPSTSSEILSQVKNNTPLEIMDASSDWWKVRTPDGTEGFMHSSRIVKGDEE